MTSAVRKLRVVSILTGWLLLKPRLMSGDALMLWRRPSLFRIVMSWPTITPKTCGR